MRKLHIQIHPAHAQNLIRAFAFNVYILKILLADSEDADQTARMHRLIWAFAVAYTRRHVFAWRGPYFVGTNYKTPLGVSFQSLYVHVEMRMISIILVNNTDLSTGRLRIIHAEALLMGILNICFH